MSAETDALLAAAREAQGRFASDTGTARERRPLDLQRQQAFYEALQHPGITEEAVAEQVGLAASTVRFNARQHERFVRQIQRDRALRIQAALLGAIAPGSALSLKLTDGSVEPLVITRISEEGIETEQGIAILYGNPYAIDKDASTVEIGPQAFTRFSADKPWISQATGASVEDLEGYARQQGLSPKATARFVAGG